MTQAAHRRRPRLLIASGVPITRHVFQRCLSRNGYDAYEVDSIAAAQRLLKPVRFDAFICEVSMPDGSGLNAMHAAKLDLNVCTVALISEEEQADTARLDAVGAFDARIGPPPFQMDQILEVIDRTVGVFVCPDCKGKGSLPLFTSISECTRCGGTGRFRAEPPPF
jgi:DNA-binding NtrC family response regulator